MEVINSGKIQRVTHRHAPEVSKQTGFPSAATHYMEASIDLNQELTHNKEATFFVRLEGNTWMKHQIKEGDVLIIDRSLKVSAKTLYLAIKDGEFVIQQGKNETEAITVWGVITYIIHRAL